MHSIQRTMRTTLLPIATLSIYTVHGYVTSAPISRPLPQAFHLPDIQLTVLPTADTPNVVTAQRKPRSVSFDVSETSSGPQKQSYDLGLGRNGPVVKQLSSKETFGIAENNVVPTTPTQYWSEYEAVRNFPSPQSQRTDEFEKPLAPAKKSRKEVPLQLKRAVQDSLTFLPQCIA